MVIDILTSTHIAQTLTQAYYHFTRNGRKTILVLTGHNKCINRGIQIFLQKKQHVGVWHIQHTFFFYQFNVTSSTPLGQKLPGGVTLALAMPWETSPREEQRTSHEPVTVRYVHIPISIILLCKYSFELCRPILIHKIHAVIVYILALL